MAAKPMSLMLRGGAYEDDLPFSDEGSGSSEGSYDESLYNLTEAYLKDPEEQGNLTHLYDLLIRPPIMPPMKDGKMLSGIGLLLSRDPPYKILSIHPQVQQAHAGLINIGDEVVAINGESLKGKSWEQVRSLALGEEASDVLLQLLPGSALNDQDGKKHPSASSVSIELSRFSDYVPPCCKPLPDDPGVGKGEEEQKFLEKHRQRVAEELAGMPLYDFGDWTKLRDPKTGKTFFHDRLRNVSQWHPPASYFIRKKLLKMSQDEFLQTAAMMQEEHEEFVRRLREKRLAELSARSEAEEEAERARIDEENLLADLRMSGIDPKEFEAALENFNDELLHMGINASAIPDRASRQIMAKFAEKMENFTHEEEGLSPLEQERLMQAVRSIDLNDTLSQEDMDRIFPKGKPGLPPMIQFADPNLPEFLRRCKTWGNGDQETEAAIAKCEAGWKVLREFDEFLAREPWKQGEIEQTLRGSMPHLPQNLCLDYYLLRDLARAQEEMKMKGPDWGTSLVHGIDPIYDRLDFRRVGFEEGKQQITYVGDCVPGGFRIKEQVVLS
uniref:WW domain-containing protein n=1 Tax=Guillardia theta TaxID=55529 RepID=A0A6U6E581_GUITH